MIFDSEWREVRKAKSQGKLDGRVGFPPVDWENGPSPFLNQLHNMYLGKIHGLKLSATSLVGQSEEVFHNAKVKSKDAGYQRMQLEKEREALEAEYLVARERLAGIEADAIGSRSPRHREIPTWLYVMTLTGLVLGEFLVTIPAVRVALGDSLVFGIDSVPYVSFSIAILSISCAHLIGLVMKGQVDRDRPQPRVIAIGVMFLGGALALTVFMLSVLRSEKVHLSAQMIFSGSQSLFGTLLFFVLQMSFVGVAIGLAYFNHSEPQKLVQSNKRRLERLNKQISRVSARENSVPKGLLTSAKREVQWSALENEYQSIVARYGYLSNVYINANLLAQPSSRKSAGSGLIPEPLPLDQISLLENLILREHVRDEFELRDPQ
jgi:hypothetical protein